MVDINKFVDGQMAAWARNDMIGMLADVGHALVQTGLKVNGVRYQDVPVGLLLMKAAAALEECWKREGVIQNAAKPENPDDVVVKVTVPDRWPMTEAGHAVRRDGDGKLPDRGSPHDEPDRRGVGEISGLYVLPEKKGIGGKSSKYI